MKNKLLLLSVFVLASCEEKKVNLTSLNPLIGKWSTTDSSQFIHGGKKLSMQFNEDRAYLIKEFDQGEEMKTDLGRYKIVGKTIEWMDSKCSQIDSYDIMGSQLILVTVSDKCNNENVGSKLCFSFVEK